MPRIAEILSKYLKDKKIKGILIILAAGIMLVFFSSLTGNEKKTEDIKMSGINIEAYRKEKESEVKKFIENIDGISSCKVMISYKDSGSTLYSYNSSAVLEREESKKENQIVLRKEEGNEYPVAEKIITPEAAGVTVICNGKKGLEITVARAVSAGLGIEIHNVEVIINERN